MLMVGCTSSFGAGRLPQAAQLGVVGGEGARAGVLHAPHKGALRPLRPPDMPPHMPALAEEQMSVVYICDKQDTICLNWTELDLKQSYCL